MEDKKVCLFTVAGITFSLEMPSDCPLWNFTGKYRQFLSPSGSVPLFKVCLVDHVPSDGTVKVYAEDDPVMPRLEAYAGKDKAFFRMAPFRDMEVVSEALVDIGSRSVTFSLLEPPSSGFALDNVLMLSYALLTADKGVLLIHASTVVEDGRGYAFLGKSGTGKSTHSRLWMEHLEGIWLLNDDNPIIRVEEDGVYVYGSPWSGKTPCYKNQRVLLGGVVSLEQAPENRIRPLPLPLAYAAIFSSSSGLRLSEVMSEHLHDTIASVVTRVRVFHLECLPDAGAAILCHQSLTAR